MKPYIRSVPKTWWLRQRSYFLFMIREFTSVFIAGYCIFLLIFVYKLSQGPEAYEQFVSYLKRPSSIILHIVALIFALYHSITWFNLTPQVFVIRVGEEKISPTIISGANIAAWIVISVIVAWIVAFV